MNLKIELFSDRIGPDLLLTHWMLYFKSFTRLLIQKRIMYVGRNVDIRPGVTIVGGKGVWIGNNVTLRPGTQIHANPEKHADVVIDNDVLIAPGVFITTNNHLYADKTSPIRYQGGEARRIHIKDGSWIAHGSTILPGVTIGRNAVVAAGAVVNKDVPDFSVVGGVPAKIIRQL